MARTDERAVTSPWEWVAAGVSTLIIGTLILFLGRDARDRGSPPRLHADLDSITAQPGQYLAHITVRNDGDDAAENVHVEGSSAGETATALIDYVPGRSRRSGGLIFTRLPSPGSLHLAVRGFQNP